MHIYEYTVHIMHVLERERDLGGIANALCICMQQIHLSLSLKLKTQSLNGHSVLSLLL